MSRYRTISIKMWGDDRFSRLSKPNPNGQTLWIYLLTGPHTTPLPGVFIAGEAALAEALDWSSAAFKKAFGEVLKEGLVETDSKTRLVFLPKAVRHNPPQSPNVVIAWRKAFDELPDCALKQRIFGHIIAELQRLGKGEAYLKAFGEAFVYTFAESEQEQEQDQNKNRTYGKGKGASRPTAPPGQLEISVEMREWARSEGFSDFEIARETPAMLDHFRGKGETKTDWSATWRNWMRRSRKFHPTPLLDQKPARPSEEEMERERQIQFGPRRKTL